MHIIEILIGHTIFRYKISNNFINIHKVSSHDVTIDNARLKCGKLKFGEE